MAVILTADPEHLTAVLRHAVVLGDVSVREVTVENDWRDDLVANCPVAAAL
jgi:hypothetical protein